MIADSSYQRLPRNARRLLRLLVRKWVRERGLTATQSENEAIAGAIQLIERGVLVLRATETPTGICYSIDFAEGGHDG